MKIQNITLKNGASDEVYLPVTAQVGATAARWKFGTTELSAKRLSALGRRVNGAAKYKSVLTLDVPKVVTTDGIEELKFTSYARVEFTFPDAITPAEREIHVKQVAGLLADAVVIDLLKNNSPAY